MCNITLILLAILLALPFSMKVDAKEWPVVGANPTTTSAWVTLGKMDLNPSVINFVQNNFPETTWVVKGMVFNEMSEGIGAVKRNVRVTFDSTKALVWHTGDVDVYYVLFCCNVGWKSACGGTAPAVEPTSPPIPTTIPEPQTKADNAGAGYFPGWFQTALKIAVGTIIALLLIIAIVGLLRLLSRVVEGWETSHPPTTPPASTTGTSPATATPPASTTGPTPEVETPKSPLDELNDLVVQQRSHQEAADGMVIMIHEQVKKMTEANLEQNEKLAAILKSLEK
jgi:hypothetical protein